VRLDRFFFASICFASLATIISGFSFTKQNECESFCGLTEKAVPWSFATIGKNFSAHPFRFLELLLVRR
jgi:hypothetical protein